MMDILFWLVVIGFVYLVGWRVRKAWRRRQARKRHEDNRSGFTSTIDRLLADEEELRVIIRAAVSAHADENDVVIPHADELIEALTTALADKLVAKADELADVEFDPAVLAQDRDQISG